MRRGQKLVFEAVISRVAKKIFPLFPPLSPDSRVREKNFGLPRNRNRNGARAALPKTKTRQGGREGGSSLGLGVKKEGRKKLRSKKWVQVTARRPTGGERRGERALLCFALLCFTPSPLLSSPLVSHLRECFSWSSRDALSSSPSFPLRCRRFSPHSPVSVPLSLRRNPIYALEVYCVTRHSSTRQKGRSSREKKGRRREE